MNNRTLRARVGAVLLVLALCLTVLPAAAASGSMQTVYLDSAEEFAAFAKSCSLDTWSQGKTFILRADISLSGVDFTPAASFGGTFEGRGHTISDFNLTENASPAGLFGTILPGGRVANLNVAGSVAAGGDKIACGGIAGENYGKIVCCTFTGMVQGDTQIGGIVGRNQASGQIVSCSFEGKVQGTTATGGIAGQNAGTIRHCTNTGSVNIDNIDSALSLSDIQIDTTLDLANLATTQTFLTTTATGGIAGRNTGLIAVCENTGTVGYEHVGYNVGGIAGTQTGYLYKCENFAQVYGRKEVGGIVGQMEPTTFIEYTEDTMQLLQSQLGTVSNLTGQAFSTIQDGNSDMGVQVDDLYNSLVDAKDALDTLLPNGDDPYPPDRDTIDAAINNANSSLAAAGSSLYAIMDSVNDTADSLSRIMRSIAGQISAMSATVGNASQNLGGTIEDISDRDTAEILSGKVEKCTNSGAVLGDLNAGGVVGAIAYENRLDPENDLQIGGDNSMNFDTQLRAVILGCENSGSVTAKRQNVGGIVGWMALGLTKDCLSTGSIDAEDANYVGGVAGRSDGYIRRCSAKSAITGNAYVGGIAGEGLTVTDCRSMVQLTGSEKTGAILGLKGEHSGFLKSESDDTDETEEDTVTGNYYLTVGSDIGAIDGVSYADSAQPLEHDDFVELEGLDPIFKVISVRFVYDDGMMHTVTLAPGEALSDGTTAYPLSFPGAEAGWAVYGITEHTDGSREAALYLTAGGVTVYCTAPLSD